MERVLGRFVNKYIFFAIIKILPIILQRMKIVGFLLAIYLIFLSAIPCCAYDNCANDKADLSAGTEQTANHQEKEDCNNCSPFFNCAGCATATISFEPVLFEIFPINTTSVYTGYLLTAFSTVEYDFWQPPKLD